MIFLRNGKVVAISSGTIPASGTYRSVAYDVAAILDGIYALEWTVTGDGTMKAEVLTSINGVTFHNLDTDITAAQTKTTGIGADGVNMAGFTATRCCQIKILFTETGAANSIVVVASLRVAH